MHKHLHLKKDGRELWLYSEKVRSYEITNDLEPLDNPPDPHMRWHPLREEWVLYNAGRNNRTFHPPNGYNPLAPVSADGFPGEIRRHRLKLRCLRTAGQDYRLVPRAKI